MRATARLTFAIVVLCFLTSGAAGLIYQVAWSRYLALFLGHTSYAVVAVLVAFMGGLALGNAFAGGIADRSAKPLAIYAWLEIAIGVYAIFFPTYYELCHDGFVAVARTLQPGSTAALGLKFAFSFLTILLPTILMGATFPVLARFVTRALSELRERVAALYAINSAGAVAGCVIADFWWIPSFGLEVTVFGGAALNLAVGLVAFVLSMKIETGARRVEAAPAAALVEPDQETYTRGELNLALVGIGVSGFVAMLYEVAWTRLLALAMGSSTHAFSLMLITFITGIGIGAWIVYLWKGLKRTLVAFAWAELALAGSLLVSMFFYQYLSFGFVQMAGLLARREEAYPLYHVMQLTICFAVMLVPTICLGMTLPLVSRIATTELSRTGRSVGKVFAINTLGTVLGAVVTGLWLMPALGMARTFAVGISLNAMIGVAALTWRRVENRKAAVLLPLAVGSAIVWLVGATLEPFWQRAFSLGLWRLPNPPRTLAAFHETVNAIPLQYHKDGAGSTVAVYAWKDGDVDRVTMKVNGKADAGTGTDMITQLLVGHLPMLLHPEAKRGLVIGLGSGMSTDAVAQHPSTERVDAVEISPEIVEGARFFAAHNNRILENPKFRLAIEDAKSFLKISDEQYDVIVSQPSNPWMAGVAAVFSREYYESCAARLAPGGIMSQWVQVYETTDETVNLILRTFGSVFPYLSVWQPTIGDLVLIGTLQPLLVNLEVTQQRFLDPAVRRDLARVGLLTLPTVLAREVIPQQNGVFVVSPDGPIHSDFYPELEYMAQKGLFLNRMAERWRLFREDFSPRAATLLGTYLRQHELTEEDYEAFVRDYQMHRFPDAQLFRSLLHRWQGNAPLPIIPLNLWATASDRIPASELRALRLAPLRDAMMEEASANPHSLRFFAADLMETYRGQRTIFYIPPTGDLESALQRLIETDPARQRLYKLHLAEIAWDRGDDARCVELGQNALDPGSNDGVIDFSADPQAPRAVLYRMTESLWRAGRVGEAWALCQEARAAGYFVNVENIFPLLEVTYRRISAAVAPSPGFSQ